MVAFLNKWLLVFVFPLFYTGGMNPQDNPGRAKANAMDGLVHPLHVSVVEINHNATDKTLEISCKLFTDDFETILGKTYHVKIDLINPPDRAAMEKLVNDYIHKHLTIKADGKSVPFSFIGYEKDNDAIYSYFQVDNIPTVKQIVVKDDIMHEMYTDQINLLHVIVGGVRKSTKMDYPVTEGKISF